MNRFIRSKILRGVLISQILLIGMAGAQEIKWSPCEQARLDVEQKIERTKEMVHVIYPDPKDVQRYYECYWEIIASSQPDPESPPHEQQVIVLIVLVIAGLVLGYHTMQEFGPLWEIKL